MIFLTETTTGAEVQIGDLLDYQGTTVRLVGLLLVLEDQIDALITNYLGPIEPGTQIQAAPVPLSSLNLKSETTND